MKETIQYLIDYLKLIFYKLLSLLVGSKLRSSMKLLLLQLELKKLLPNKINALEMFGMHGLWHTMDYLHLVDSLDIFELNQHYHKLSRLNLRGYKVNFYNEDSIKFIHNTTNKYNFIVADIPFNGPFYDENGLPLFLDDMIRIASDSSVIIFNLHSSRLQYFEKVQADIKDKVKNRIIKDLFFVPKNSSIGYVALILQ